MSVVYRGDWIKWVIVQHQEDILTYDCDYKVLKWNNSILEGPFPTLDLIPPHRDNRERLIQRVAWMMQMLS